MNVVGLNRLNLVINDQPAGYFGRPFLKLAATHLRRGDQANPQVVNCIAILDSEGVMVGFDACASFLTKKVN